LAVVLSGGGARAAYQVGVLSAIAERVPTLRLPILSGVSAGAINTITLAAHPGPFKARVRALHDEWAKLTVDQVYRVRLGGLASSAGRWVGQRVLRRRRAPTVVRGLMDLDPLRAFLVERVNLRGIQANISGRRLRAVSLSATCYGSGETITFVQGSDDVNTWVRAQRRAVKTKLTWDHVIASASIPIFFPAVRVEGAYYGDGSVRQAAPLAPAVHIGSDRILAIGMRPAWGVRKPAAGTEYPSAAQVMGLLFHSIFLDTLDADAERLSRLNQVIDAVPQTGAGEKQIDDLRHVDLLVVRPSLDLGALARPHFHRLPPLMRSIVKGIGGEREGAADFVSYLLFDPAYTVPLMQLGYDDARAQWDEIERFLAAGE
jgi:NTE family protein